MQTNQTTSPVSTNQSNETELTGDPEKDKKIKNLTKVCIKVFFYHRLPEDFRKRLVICITAVTLLSSP